MTKILDSWERLAGSVHDMSEYPRRKPLAGPRGDARVLPFGRLAPKPDASMYRNNLADIEPYDPSKHHEPPALHSQADIDRLEGSGTGANRTEGAGFSPVAAGVWGRSVPSTSGEGKETHFIGHTPGFKSSDGRLTPWWFQEGEDSAYQPFATSRGAVAAADAHARGLRALSHWTNLGVHDEDWSDDTDYSDPNTWGDEPENDWEDGEDADSRNQTTSSSRVNDGLVNSGWTPKDGYYHKTVGDKIHVLVPEDGGWIHNSGPVDGTPNEYGDPEMTGNPIGFTDLQRALMHVHRGQTPVDFKPPDAGLRSLNSFQDSWETM